MRARLSLFTFLFLAGCPGGGTPPPDAGPPSDVGVDGGPDAGPDCHANPTADGCMLPAEPTYTGPSAAIDVIRDDMGIPHLYAANDADAYYASGYLQATDRLFEMDLTRRHALGTRAEVLGPDAVGDDTTIRLFNIPRWAELSRRALLLDHPDVYALLVAWCDGVNARIDEIHAGTTPLPYGFGPAELDYMPTHWAPIDALAVGTLILFGNAEQIEYDVLASVLHNIFPTLEQRVPFFAPMEPAHTLPPEERPTPGHAARFDPPTGPPALAPADLSARMTEFFDRFHAIPLGASNNWAIDGAHTQNGRPLLAGDPHQGLQSPSLMWTHHMNSAEHGGSLDVIGFNFVGTPSIELGHNAHVAWAATTTYPDWNDLWGVDATGDPVTSISYGGHDVPVVLRHEAITVKGEATPRLVAIEDVPSLPGVLMPDSFFPIPIYPGRRILMRWAGMQPSSDAAGFHRFDTATSTAEFEAAVDLCHLGAFNFVGADAHGITYRSPPWVPIRAGEITATRSPFRVLDGDDVGSLWTGTYLTPDQMPHSHGGVRGWIGTANDEPYGLTDDGSVLGDPLYFGVYFDPGTRAQRIESEIGRLVARGDVSRDDMLALQDDTYLLFADEFLPGLFAAWDGRATDNTLNAYAARADLAALVEGLRAWDRRMERGSPDAVVFDAFMFELSREVLADDMSALFDPIMGQSPTYIMKLLTFVARDTTTVGDSFFQQGRTLAYVRALDTVATTLTARFGSSARTSYTWEMIHGTRFDGIWGGSTGRLDGGWIPTDGSLGTINVADASYFDGMHHPNMRLDATGGSIFRLAVQFRDDGTPDAVVNIPRGVSGDPDSPHFDDLQADWQVNHSRPLAFLRADVEAHAESRFTIPAAH